MIQKAALFAAKAHEGMIRKGSRIPYIYHPMEVALIVAQMTDDPEVIAAAYLHDVLEDTSVTPEELEQNFGSRVLSFVMAESEDKSRTWRERKASTIAHLKRAPREVKLLTLGDKLSNMRSTARDYMVIGDEICSVSTKSTGNATSGIWKELWMACRNCGNCRHFRNWSGCIIWYMNHREEASAKVGTVHSIYEPCRFLRRGEL